MVIQVRKRGSHIHQTAKETEPHNIILPGTIIKVWIRNIRETVSIQGQVCQLPSKFFDNMDYIIIINCSHTKQAQFFQALATVCNKADCVPT